MINSAKLEKYRNSEFIAYGKDVIGLIEGAGAASLALGPNYTNFKSEWESLSDFFVLQRGSTLTDDLVALDNRRDDAIIGIKTLAEGFGRHFEATKKAASERVLSVFNKYGNNIARANFLAETEIIRNLADDFEKDAAAKAALTELGLSPWLAELVAANNAFNLTYLNRTQEAGEKPDVALADKRKPAMDLYRKLVDTIKAKDILAPSPELTRLASQMNELIAKYNQLVSARSGKSGKEEDSDPE